MDTTKIEQQNTNVHATNERSKIIALAGIIVIVLVAIGIYLYIRKNPGSSHGPIHITQAQIDAFNAQVAAEPVPAYSKKETNAFAAQVSNQPTGTFTQSQIAAFNAQVANTPQVVLPASK